MPPRLLISNTTTLYNDVCSPVVYNSDIKDIINIETFNLDPDDLVDPCGQLPRYFPTDDFLRVEEVETATTYPLTTDGVWDGDTRYQYLNSDDISKQWLNVTDPRFFNWMKHQSTSGTYKTWGILNENLEAGKYYLHINIEYDVSFFNGDKNFIVTANTNYYSIKNNGTIALLCLLAVALIVMFILLVLAWVRNKDN